MRLPSAGSTAAPSTGVLSWRQPADALRGIGLGAAAYLDRHQRGIGELAQGERVRPVVGGLRLDDDVPRVPAQLAGERPGGVVLQVVERQRRVSSGGDHPQPRHAGRALHHVPHRGVARDQLGEPFALAKPEQLRRDRAVHVGADEHHLGVGPGERDGQVGGDHAAGRARRRAGHEHDVVSLTERRCHAMGQVGECLPGLRPRGGDGDLPAERPGRQVQQDRQVKHALRVHGVVDPLVAPVHEERHDQADDQPEHQTAGDDQQLLGAARLARRGGDVVDGPAVGVRKLAVGRRVFLGELAQLALVRVKLGGVGGPLRRVRRQATDLGALRADGRVERSYLRLQRLELRVDVVDRACCRFCR